MTYFGRSTGMKKIKEDLSHVDYNTAKAMLNGYVKEMEAWYDYHKKLCDKRDSELNDDIDDIYEYEVGKKFMKTWDIINTKLSKADRNLILVHNMLGKSSENTLRVFNLLGDRKKKNYNSLNATLTFIRQKIRRYYNDD